VPEICRFLGIVITMYHREHEPPHFHARYAGQKITVRIADGGVERSFPPRALGHVMEWWSLSSCRVGGELAVAQEGGQPKAIEPLG
jgi:hypothetical protein